MGQVPENICHRPYLIVGNGKVARHFRHYFDLLSIPYHHWYRKNNQKPDDFIAKSDRILVLISDPAIIPFLRQHAPRHSDQKIWIHCSGLVTTPLATGAHPLMTFSNTLYDLNTYQKIPFVCEAERRPFPELFPRLNNPHSLIQVQLKPLYHAWCVMSGNFSTILWHTFFETLEKQFDLPKTIAFPYLEQIARNLETESDPLTGPVARQDYDTINCHLEYLAQDPFQLIYQAFVKTCPVQPDTNGDNP